MARRSPVAHYLPDDLPIVVMRDHRQDPMDLHTHPFFELVVITRGRAVHTTDAGDFPIAAGDVFVVSGERAHGYARADGLVLTNILFHPERLAMPMQDVRALSGYHALFTLEPQQRARHRFDSRLHLGADELDRVRAWCESLDDELRRQTPGYRFVATALFMQMVGFLSRCYSEPRQPSEKPLHRVAQAIGYLEENYASPVRLAEVQRVTHMSKTSLLRAFREGLGTSPIDYLIRLRVSRACELLRDRALSVTEAAFLVGFSDSNYFARQFRAVMGMSPREYRRGRVPAR